MTTDQAKTTIFQAQMAAYPNAEHAAVLGEMYSLIEELEQYRSLGTPEYITKLSADVAPVKHGEWEAGYKSGTKVSNGAVCSECDCWSARRSSFCPNCGADMRRS